MLVTSFFLPHSPVLIPRIGKMHTDTIPQTIAAFEKAATTLEQAKLDYLIVLSAHGESKQDLITVNLNPSYKLDLTEFGDLTSRQSWRPASEAINHLTYTASKHFKVNLISEETLDYGTSIPLYLLTKNMPALKIVPITYGDVSLVEMFRFGAFLEQEIAILNKRVSIIATGDLSHRLTEESVSGFSPSAQAFDRNVTQAFKDNDIASLQSMPPELLEEVGQCGLRALMVLAGAMQNKNSKNSVLSYETSLGIGYLSGVYELT